MRKIARCVVLLIGVAALLVARPIVAAQDAPEDLIALYMAGDAAYLRVLRLDGTVESNDFVVPAGWRLIVKDVVSNAPVAGNLVCIELRTSGNIAAFQACRAPVNGFAGIGEHFSSGVAFAAGSKVFVNVLGASPVQVWAYGLLIQLTEK